MKSQTAAASKSRQFWIAGTAMAAALSCPWSAASAQSADEDVIVVTGTRIRQANLDSPVAVQTLTSEMLELSGSNNPQDALRELPVSGIPGLSSTNSNFATQFGGINTVDLRNLGEDRNLVLLNNRRFIGGVAGSNQVDFNMIPLELIERVDVITGGASAVYGSDALAGVINVVTKHDFEGLTTHFRAGISERGDAENYNASITLGSNFDGDRGNAVLNASWSTDNGIFARDRHDQTMDVDCAATGASVTDFVCPAFSSFPPNTRLVFADGPTSAVSRVLDGGSVVPFSTPVHGFNRAAFRNLSVPVERFSFQTFINYDLTPSAELFIEAIYGRTETHNDIEPFAIQTDDIYPTQVFCDSADFDSDGDGNITECHNGVSLSNPLIPQVIRDAVLARPGNAGRTVDDLKIGFARRLAEVGTRGADAERQTFRFLTGVRGDINSDVHYEIALNYARTSDAQTGEGQVNTSNIRDALDAIDLDGDPTTTNDIVCRDEAARAIGCVPLDIFSGEGSITPEMLTWIDAITHRQAFNEQTYAIAFLEGEAHLPFFPEGIGWALGAEHRSETAADITDALTRTGQNGGNVAASTSGQFSVSEVFGELQVPLLRDQPFARELSLNLAGRRSTYQRAQSELDTNAYAASFEWQPVENLRFRAQYARAVRAPNVGELFGPPGETFAVVDDPCSGLTLSAGTPAFFNERENVADPSAVFASGVDASTIGAQDAVNCYADPLIAQRVNATGGLVLTQSEVQGVGGFVGGGSVDLFEETADTVSYGFVLRAPLQSPWLSGLTLSVDYYDIEIDDGVGSLGRQNSLNRCYGAGTVGFDSATPFCTNVHRFALGPSVGALDAVDSNLQNLATIATSGVDYQVGWNLDFTDAGFLQGTPLASGRIDLSINYTHLNEYVSEAFPGNGVQDFTDTVGVPRDKGVVRFNYRQGPLTWTWNAAYIGEIDIFGENSGYTLDTTWFHSTQLRFNLSEAHEVYIGVNNVFDEYRFVAGSNGDFTQAIGWTTFPDIYDGVGRRYAVGTRLRF